MNDSPFAFLVETIMDHASTIPAPQRATLYRGLASIIADESISAKLVQMADSLEEIEASHRQLKSTFIAKR